MQLIFIIKHVTNKRVSMEYFMTVCDIHTLRAFVMENTYRHDMDAFHTRLLHIFCHRPKFIIHATF